MCLTSKSLLLVNRLHQLFLRVWKMHPSEPSCVTLNLLWLSTCTPWLLWMGDRFWLLGTAKFRPDSSGSLYELYQSPIISSLFCTHSSDYTIKWFINPIQPNDPLHTTIQAIALTCLTWLCPTFPSICKHRQQRWGLQLLGFFSMCESIALEMADVK